MNTKAWDNRIRLFLDLICLRGRVMISRESWGYSDLEGRGEILRSFKDDQERKRLTRTLPLIKNESWGIEDDQIPS
jgi:hypothetical protein